MNKIILVIMAMYWCLHMIIHLLDMQALAFKKDQWERTLILNIFKNIKSM
jgi:hypothetical protein